MMVPQSTPPPSPSIAGKGWDSDSESMLLKKQLQATVLGEVKKKKISQDAHTQAV
jgi:hypothetical protein